VCHQIGRINTASRQLKPGVSSPFQTFVVECRQPFYDVVCGTTHDQQVASKQLHTFLVASSSTLVGRDGRGGRRNARGIELAEIIPPPTPTNQLDGQGGSICR
jgi:hypothetical protein